MNVVITNLKGGVGKTTTAVYLAAVAVAKGHDPVLLIDADRQASSAEWLEERPIEGVEVVEAPSERMLIRAMDRHEGTAFVDTPPGDERLVQSASIPRRRHHPDARRRRRVPARRGDARDDPARTPRGVLIAAARLGTNDLDETIAWWKGENVPVWGVIPERVGIAAGPEARLYREGLNEYDAVLRRALRKR